MATRAIATEQLIRGLKVEDVVKVYSGRDGKCCCGCSGKYSYAWAYRDRDLGSKESGYTLKDAAVSDKMVRRVFALMQAEFYADNEVEVYHDFASFVIGERLYIVYFKHAIDKAVAA